MLFSGRWLFTRPGMAPACSGRTGTSRSSPLSIVQSPDLSGLTRVIVGLTSALALLVLVPTDSSAQLTRGSIAGTVWDASGGIVQGAAVTVRNMETNAVQATTTNEHGFYRVGALEPGIYEVVTELAGFGRVEQTEVFVRPASETPLDVMLQPAGIGEVVTVTAEATALALNKSSPTIGATISARMVSELPLGGAARNINNLIATMPNVVSTTGQGTFAANGNRPRNNNYMIDGSDNNDISVTIATSALVPESVAEFQVLQNPYSVEFGRNSGAQVNVITKSGTNTFRGDVWDYYTSSNFYTLTNIEKASGLEKPARFNRHQMGANLGGRVVRDRLFFYGLFQRDTQRPGARPSPTTVRIPTPEGYAALQGVPLGAGQTAASRQAVLQRINFLPDVYAQNVPLRTLTTTLVNGVPIQTGLVNVSLVDPSTYNTYLGRGDYRAGNNDNFTVRYSLNDRQDSNAISNRGFGPLFSGSQDLVDTNVAASNAHIFSPRMLNEFRFSLVRRNLDFPENDPNSPTATITGLFTVGGAANFPQYRITDSYQFSNTTTYTLSRHTLKFGADIRYLRVDNGAAFNSKGAFVFNNLQDYMNNNAFSFTQALQTASFFAKQWQTYWFVQDDFRITPDLTLNLGLRYEYSQVPLGMFGATDAESLGALVPGPARPDKNNWAPRAGFAYSPRTNHWLLGDGKTVFRGGFGVGYDVIFYNLLVVNASNYPRVVTATEFNVQNVYPNLLPVSATPVFNPLAGYVNSPEDTQNPASRFYSLTMQREVANNYLFEIGYSGSRGYNGINQVIMNPSILTPEQAALVASTQNAAAIPGIATRRIFPQYGPRTMIPAYVGPGGNDVEARSEYHALILSGGRRFTRGLQINGHYTYSRYYSNNDASLGEGGTGESSQRPQSMFDYGAEWSRSNFDRPHRLALSYLWEIPGPRSGVLGHVLGGWQIAGVTSGQSGRPFTILTGVDSNGDSNVGSDRPNINPAGSFTWDNNRISFTNNGYYVVPLGTNNLPLANSLGDGNAPRNSERSAPIRNTDLSLMKRFPVGTHRLAVRVDAFNAFNQPDYGVPVNNMSSPSFGQNTANWGRRVITFSGKYTF